MSLTHQNIYNLPLDDKMRADLVGSADHQRLEDDIPTPIPGTDNVNNIGLKREMYYSKSGSNIWVGVNIYDFKEWARKYGHLYGVNENSFNQNNGKIGI